MAAGHAATHKCGCTQVLIFIAAIISGTACSICSKTMMQLHSTGITGQEEVFAKPIFQTFGMFVGMMFGLVMHWAVLVFKIPFPGYDTYHGDDNDDPETNGNKLEEGYHKYASETDALIMAKKESNGGTEEPSSSTTTPTVIPIWMYFFLAIPSVFDLGATALCMMGLRYINVSIYQLLRGSGIIFVALMKQHVLGDRLFKFQWLGVFWNVVSVGLVGSTAILGELDAPEEETTDGNALLGVMLVLAGALVQACQFVFEEKVMTMDIPSPPLLLIGMEGFWGTLLCLVAVYPLVYYLPGDDHGSYEDPYNTFAMIVNSSTVQWWFVVYFCAVFMYNLFAVLVTFMLNSVWHAILDNFRPITVWGTDLFIFYVITAGAFGEAWTKWSYIQLAGMFVLLYGTAVYNAPNAGSILLTGKWYDLWFDFSSEYREIQMMEEEAELDAHWQEMQRQFLTKKNSGSFYGERSPFMSVHTQALRGLTSPKI